MTENNFLSLIIFAPLIGAVINWLVGKKLKSELFSGAVACTAVGISTVVAFMIAFGIGTPHVGALFAPEGKPVLDQIWTWIQVQFRDVRRRRHRVRRAPHLHRDTPKRERHREELSRRAHRREQMRFLRHVDCDWIFYLLRL